MDARTAALKAANKEWFKAHARHDGGDEHALDYAYKNAYTAALKAARKNGMDGLPAVQLAAEAAVDPREP